MYNELIESSRSCAMGYNGNCDRCLFWGMSNDKNGDCYQQLHNAAADAIEKLSCRETPMKITEIHVDEYYCPACGAENNCDQGYVQDAYCPACGQRLLSERPKEET